MRSRLGAAAYPTGREHIMLAGPKAKRARVCASQRQTYGYLRIDPCVEYAEAAADAFMIKSSRDVARLAESFLAGASMQEHVWVISLDARNKVLGWQEVFRGGRDSASVDRTILLQSPILVGAVAFIMVHNHPSEEVAPSDADVALTKEVVVAGNAVGIKLLDHIIVSRHDSIYFSFLDSGLLHPSGRM